MAQKNSKENSLDALEDAMDLNHPDLGWGLYTHPSRGVDQAVFHPCQDVDADHASSYHGKAECAHES
ncbi:MAG: hypothetical protein AAFY98_09895 [Verrucomicrobiota bacterium]